MTIEIMDFPINSMVIFSYVSHYQRVYLCDPSKADPATRAAARCVLQYGGLGRGIPRFLQDPAGQGWSQMISLPFDSGFK